MSKVIIGIHGLGNKPPRYLLKKWWKDSMSEGLRRAGLKKDLPEFELVYWADLLYEKPLNFYEKNRDSPWYLEEPYRKAPQDFVIEDHTFRRRVVDFVSEQLDKIFLNEDLSLNYSTITDMILKRFFWDLEIYYTEKCADENDRNCKVRGLIRDRVARTIRKYRDYDIMIIGHSMGSIIAFDVMSFMTSDIRVSTFVTIGSPIGLPVVASKIAAEHKKLTGECGLITPSCITKGWYNLADILDKVALHYKLSRDFRKNAAGILPVDMQVNNDYETDGTRNPHKSYGYLRTPEFSGILDDFIGEEKLNITQKVIGSVQTLVNHAKRQRDKVKEMLNIDQK